jgi:hypothetical protein
MCYVTNKGTKKTTGGKNMKGLRKGPHFVIVQNGWYQYTIYQRKFIWDFWIGHATINLNGTEVTLYADKNWEDYKDLIGQAVKQAHILLNKQENTRAEK